MASTTDESLQPTGEPVRAEQPSGMDNISSSVLSRVTRLPTWLNFWVPLLSSLVALVLAAYSLIISTQDPEVLLILPNRIYMSEADPGGSDYHPNAIYVQPNFVSAGNNDRTELIRGMTLRIESSGGQPLSLEWREQGKWDFAEGFEVMKRTYTYLADAAPMLISPNQAQQPLAVFPIESEWTLQAGANYRLTLTADRVVAPKPLVGVADMNVSAGAIDAIKRQTQQTILGVPVVPVVQP